MSDRPRSRVRLSLAAKGASVTGRYLLAVFDSVYLIALASWVGSTLFFSFGVAPIMFKEPAADAAGRLVRALYPRYYLWGAISGAVALPAFVAGPLCYHEYRGAMVGVQALAMIGCILVMLHGGNSLATAMNLARDGGASGLQRFQRLHRRAVRLNALVMVVGLVLLVAFATRPAPRTSGIIELSPEERGRYDAAISRVIVDVETKYGLRPPRAAGSGEAKVSEPTIDAETIKEIESYYARKRLRDQARARRPSGSAPASGTRTAVRPEPPPGSTQPTGSGEPRVE
jgi:hypothetical protein